MPKITNYQPAAAGTVYTVFPERHNVVGFTICTRGANDCQINIGPADAAPGVGELVLTNGTATFNNLNGERVTIRSASGTNVSIRENL